MKQMLRDIWNRDRKGFLTILILNVIVSMTGGISIVMLIPMLGLLDISQGSVSALAFFTAPLQNLPYGAQVHDGGALFRAGGFQGYAFPDAFAEGNGIPGKLFL